ncbi:MAG TPA: S53 family peptidase [Ktedonobacteraceae bacterium]|nr:S53 family peptidase [Ktedonobacteraceae bacterium]
MTVLHRLSRNLNYRLLAAITGILLFTAPLLASCGTPAPLQFTNLDLHLPAQALNAPVVGPLPDTTPLRVGITFKVSQSVLNHFDSQKIQPGHPSNLEQFANQIGIDDATYQKIKDFFSLGGIGLQLSKLRTHLTITAKAGTFAKLLQTKFVTHKLDNRTFFAPTKSPRLPKFLVDSIDAITGLDNYSVPPQTGFLSQSLALPHSKQRPAQDCNALNQTLLPRDVAHAYGYDQLWNRGWHGENMTVNLVEIDAFDSNDIQNYFDCINFKGKFQYADIDGTPSRSLGESTLDIEMVAGLARSVNINDYETDGNSDYDVWTQVNDILQQIINDNTNNANSGSVVSISLGTTESDLTQNDRIAIDKSIQLLTQVEHMTVFIASGDCGAFTDRIYRSLSVSFPASDPWATSVGGTILSIRGNQDRANEIAWSDASNLSTCKNQWGSGGGVSRTFARPSWQSADGVNNQYSSGGRQIPDIAAAAYALAVYYNGQWGAVGGTSAAAPIWAAGISLVNEGLMKQIGKFAYSPRMFYLVANKHGGRSPFYDVTRGNNLYYPATSGWDYTTGLGTPNLADFYQVICDDIM